MSTIVTNVADGSTFGPGQKMALGPYIDNNLVTNASALVVTLGGVADANEVVMPYAGSILAITIALQTVMTAGTLEAWATKNGTTVLSSGSMAAADAKAKYATQTHSTDTFVAGDRIGVKVTTSTDYAPTTNDVVCTVFVEC